MRLFVKSIFNCKIESLFFFFVIIHLLTPVNIINNILEKDDNIGAVYERFKNKEDGILYIKYTL